MKNLAFLLVLGLFWAGCGETAPKKRYSRVYPEENTANKTPSDADADVNADDSLCDKDFYVTWLHTDSTVTSYKVGYGETEIDTDIPVAYWNEGGKEGETLSVCFSNSAILEKGKACFAVWARNEFGISERSDPQCVER